MTRHNATTSHTRRLFDMIRDTLIDRLVDETLEPPRGGCHDCACIIAGLIGCAKRATTLMQLRDIYYRAYFEQQWFVRDVEIIRQYHMFADATSQLMILDDIETNNDTWSDYVAHRLIQRLEQTQENV